MQQEQEDEAKRVKIITEDEVELNKGGLKVHDKPEGVVTMEKEKAKHLNKANSKIVQSEANIKIVRDEPNFKIRED